MRKRAHARFISRASLPPPPSSHLTSSTVYMSARTVARNVTTPLGRTTMLVGWARPAEREREGVGTHRTSRSPPSLVRSSPSLSLLTLRILKYVAQRERRNENGVAAQRRVARDLGVLTPPPAVAARLARVLSRGGHGGGGVIINPGEQEKERGTELVVRLLHRDQAVQVGAEVDRRVAGGRVALADEGAEENERQMRRDS